VLLLDTDVLIDVQRNYPPAVKWFGELAELPHVPGFVVMELLQDANNAQQIHRALKLVEPLGVIWPSEADCELALALFRDLHLPRGLGLLDSLIAACALGRSATLCSFNVKHFRAVPELELQRPYVK
jgi:predicted nucleic acid-binding protein